MVSCVTLNTKAWVVICWDGVITKMKCDLQSNVIPYLAETGHFWTRKPLKSSYHGWNNRHCKFAREMIFCSICSRLIMLICRHPHLLRLSFGLIENLCTLDFKQWLAEDFTKRVYHRISMQLTSSFFREIKSDNDALFTSWSCVRRLFYDFEQRSKKLAPILEQLIVVTAVSWRPLCTERESARHNVNINLIIKIGSIIKLDITSKSKQQQQQPQLTPTMH